MKVYLAGKVRKNCWRHEVVEGLGNPLGEKVSYNCSDAILQDGVDRLSEELRFPVLKNAIFNEHDYTGPYFIKCDHGCWHGSNTHGLKNLDRNQIAYECLAAVDRADFVFAWIDTPDCFGTITEIGYARAKGKLIVIAGPERFADLWFVYSMADVVIELNDPVRALRRALTNAPAS